MKGRIVVIAWVSWVLLCAGQIPAGAQQLNARDLKRAVKQAEKARAAGQVAEAVGLYEQILASTEPGDGRRAEALYVTAMAHLAPDPAPRDAAAATTRLEDLAREFPHYRRLEVAAARASLEELAAARAEAGRGAQQLAEQQAAFAAERQEIAGASAAVGDQVKTLEAQLRKARSELAATEAELAKKEEALQKLKDSLVGKSGT